MPVTQDMPAPYAPPSAILGVVERNRNRGLPSPINAEVLARAGVSESLIPRTLQALASLDLINDDGSHSDTLEGLRRAPEPEFKNRMVEWLNRAYADALAFIDPATADEIQIRDAFRSYRPTGQQDRMVTLFSSLYAAAGVREGKERQPVRRSSATGQRINIRSASPKRSTAAAAVFTSPVSVVSQDNGLPPALAGLMASLPKNGQGWTKDQRDKFVATIGAVLDFCFPIIMASEQPETATDL